MQTRRDRVDRSTHCGTKGTGLGASFHAGKHEKSGIEEKGEGARE